MGDSIRSLYYNEEIDLINVIKVIWSWKWTVIALTLAWTLSVFLYLYLVEKPETYTASSTIKIGKVAGILINDLSGVQDYLSKKKPKCLSGATIRHKGDPISKNIKVSFEYTSNSEKDSSHCVKSLVTSILEKDEKEYSAAMSGVVKSLSFVNKSTTVIDPKYYLNLTNFKTHVLVDVEEPIKPKQSNKQVGKRTTIAFIASLFFSVFVVISLDYLLKIKARSV